MLEHLINTNVLTIRAAIYLKVNPAFPVNCKYYRVAKCMLVAILY